jgi:chromosome segregation ATPase
MYRSLDAQRLWAKEQSEIRVGAAVAESRDTTIAQLRADIAAVTAERDAALLRETEHYEHARTATESALKTCIRARERLQADIVAVTAERQELLIAERAAHAETRKALEEIGSSRFDAEVALESARAELAKAEARVKLAVAELQPMIGDCFVNKALEALRG